MSALSRRTVLTGLGAAALSTALPATPMASYRPFRPSIEGLLGAKRMVALREMFRAQDDRIINSINETALLDDHNRFRVSQDFRDKWVQFVLHDTPFEQLVDFDDLIEASDGQRYVQAKVEESLIMVFHRFEMIDPEFEDSVPEPYPWRICWWRGDDWKKAGWHDPSDDRYWLRSPTLYSFKLAYWGQYLNA
ncbi:hypothetical protein ACTZWT_15620 [Rhodopseudomonas sp. NSM]|uniref:hypothetical protein n=1 Tax=Rhodopseudomonas sp. NSM TaxID=3457630 RepID=UPI0040356FD7